MSLLNQLFNRGVFGSKCKTCLNLAISRIKLLQNKRDLQLKHMRKEIAQFLQAGQEAIARIRVEHAIREQNIRAAYEILELFCEFVLVRVPILENQKECPAELREAIASIIFAAPRCSEVPDLLQIKNLFATKYGKEFNMAASELRPDSGVNRAIIERLSVSAPPAETRLKVLKEIAQEFCLEWDSSNTEAELWKMHEDLLGGSKRIVAEAILPQAPTKQSSLLSPPSNGAHSTLNTDNKQGSHHREAPAFAQIYRHSLFYANQNTQKPQRRENMALRLWASSTANALRISVASTAHHSPSCSLSRCFSTVVEGLKYASSHEWVKHEGPVATIGITDHAQDHLGEVVFVDLPEPAGSVSQGKSFGAVESVKATSDINSPISGEIVEVNTKLSETPGLINKSPYEEGWMIKVKPSNPSELESLLGPKEYTKFCEEEDSH